MSDRGPLADLRLWAQKWRWYERNSLPWNRSRIHREMARRRAFVRWPVHGNVLEALRAGRLTVGAGTLLEPGVWLTAPAGPGSLGEGCFLNLGVMVAAMELVEIGSHCMFANGCFVTDANHRFDDPRAAGHLAGVQHPRPDAAWRQHLVRRQRGHHQRGDRGGALRDRRQQRRHHRPAAVLHRRRGPRARAAPGRLPPAE